MKQTGQIKNWEYFFGTKGFRYYKAEVNGVRVEKLSTKKGDVYSVGNMDNASKTVKSEAELIKMIQK